MVREMMMRETTPDTRCAPFAHGLLQRGWALLGDRWPTQSANTVSPASMPIVSSWMRTTETKTAQMASERVIFFTFGKTELLELFCQSVFIDAVFSCVGDEESDDGNDNLHVPEL